MGFFITLIVTAALFVAAELLRPKQNQEQAKPTTVGDFSFPTATEDRVKPLGWGTFRTKGPNVTWYGDLRIRPITESVKTGLFTQERIKRGDRYDMGIVFKVARGTEQGGYTLKRIWNDADEVWSGTLSTDGATSTITQPDLYGGDEFGSGGLEGTFSWYTGSLTQPVNAYLDNLGSNGIAVNGTTTRWLRDCYLVFEQGYIGNSTSPKPWSMELQRIPNPLGLSVAGVNGDLDCNPLNAAYEAMTDSEWGLGFPAGDFNLSSWQSKADTLRSEGNGFSFQLDRPIDVWEFLDIIQEQIDGVIYLDHTTGLWDVALARPGTSTHTIGEEDDVTWDEFTTGTWSNTITQVVGSFSSRANNYEPKPARAQDPAGAISQGGGSARTRKLRPTRFNMPGVKDETLANSLVWNRLRTLSVPLRQAKIRVDRSFYDVKSGGLITIINEERDMPSPGVQFRVKSANYGELRKGVITLEVIENVWQYNAGSYGNPPVSGWTPPKTVPGATPTDDQVAFEAPRALVRRGQAPGGTSAIPGLFIATARPWVGARQVTGGAGFDIGVAYSSGTPGTPGTIAGATTFAFMLRAELASALDNGVDNPSSITLTADPDTVANILAAFGEFAGNPATVEDLGENLAHLCMIGDPGSGQEEFFACTTAADSSGDVLLTGVYRGLLDTVQKGWAAGQTVYLIFAGGSLPLVAIPGTNNVKVRVIPRSPFGAATSGFVDISFTNANRAQRPYPPGRITLNSVNWDRTNVSLEGTGSGAEDFGIDVDYIRRGYEHVDEIDALSTDGATLDPSWSQQNQTITAEIIDISSGSSLLITQAGLTGTSTTFLRLAILQATDGIIPTDLRITLEASADDYLGGGATRTSRYKVSHDFTVATGLSGYFEFGALDTNDESAHYTADAAGTHVFNLSSSFTGGNVQYDIDTGGGFTGSWTTIISAGSTGPGNIAGVGVGDIIKLRHTSGDSSALKQLTMTAPGGGTNGFAVLFT